MSDPIVIVIPTPPPTAVVSVPQGPTSAVVPNQVIVPEILNPIDGGTF